MEGDHQNTDKIVADFSLKEGDYCIFGNRLDLRIRSANGGQYIGSGHPINAPHQGGHAGGYTSSGNAGGLPAGGVNSSASSSSSSLEPLRLSSQSYYLDGDLCEMLGINYSMATYWYAYRGANRSVELDMHKIDRRFYRGCPPTAHDLCDVYQVEDKPNGASEVYHLNLVGFTHGQVQLTDYRGGQNNGRTFNEEKAYEQSKVTCVKWLPNSENEFVVGHLSGNLYHYSAAEPNHSGVPVFVPVAQKDTYIVYQSRAAASTTSQSQGKGSQSQLQQNGVPSSAVPRNPLHKWIVGHGAVNEVQFAPHTANRLNRTATATTLMLALATADGFVRIFDFHGRELIGQMKSYFGAMLCVAWSGDGILLAAGAEDDLVHVYSMQENRVILRCQGHRSWVSAVSFDSHFVQSRAHESMLLSRTLSQSHSVRRHSRSYRLGSVSHDTHLALWDIDESLLLAASKERKSRTRSTGTSVSRYSENMPSPKTSESQHHLGMSMVSSSNSKSIHSQHSESTSMSTNFSCTPSGPSQNLAPNTHATAAVTRSNSLPGSKVNKVNNADPKQGQGSPSKGKGEGAVVDVSHVVPLLKEKEKKDKTTPLSMFRSSSSSSSSNASGGGSGSTKSQSGSGKGGLHHINRQKVKVEEEAQLLFATGACPRNGTIPSLEPSVYAKASFERLTAIVFMANCFVVGGKEGFVTVYARPAVFHSPVQSPRHSESGDYLSSVPESNSQYQLAPPPPQQKAPRSYQQHHHQQQLQQAQHHHKYQQSQVNARAAPFSPGPGGDPGVGQQQRAAMSAATAASRIPSSNSGHQLSSIGGAAHVKQHSRGE